MEDTICGEESYENQYARCARFVRGGQHGHCLYNAGELFVLRLITHRCCLALGVMWLGKCCLTGELMDVARQSDSAASKPH